MARVATLVGAHLTPLAAQAIVGFVDSGVTATGSNSQTGSYAIQHTNTFVTTAPANSGVLLPPASPGDKFFISNLGASTMHIYPPVGGALNGGSANAAYDIATLIGALCVCNSADGLSYTVIKGA